MMKLTWLAASASCCAALLLCGCADTNVVFATKSSLGIDVDTTARSASLAYDRSEAYVAPRFAGQDALPVYASLATLGDFSSRSIKQIYATGDAAKLVSTPGGTSTPVNTPVMYRNVSLAAPLEAQPGSSLVEGPRAVAPGMFFGTGTVVGLKLAFGPSVLDAFTLGYKRKELSVIPQQSSDGILPSVMASIDTGTAVTNGTGSQQDISQFFATGDAAIGLANNQKIRDKFENEAESHLAQYREDERQQRRYALLSLACLSELDDAHADKVYANVEAIGMFDAGGLARLQGAATPAAKRTAYTKEIGITDGNSQVETALLRAHQVYVCGLR
jgi:hypothetical protein